MFWKAVPDFYPFDSENLEKIYVSAGKVGFQIELSPLDLINAAGCIPADIV